MGSGASSSRYGRSLLSADDPWASYARIEVRIRRTPHEVLVVRAAPPGEVGSWSWPGTERVHVMTAWDPGDARPGLEENRRRQSELEKELRLAAGSTTVLSWPASGLDPVTGYRDEGVAVSGMSDAKACSLAARFGQEAVFSWSPLGWAIVACGGTRRLEFGWTVEVCDPA